MSKKTRYGFTLGLGWNLVPRVYHGNSVPCAICPDMGIEGDIEDVSILRHYADMQRVHLYTMSLIIDKVKAKGWHTYGRWYTVLCSKVCTEDEAVADLRELGLSEYSLQLAEWELEKFKEVGR